MKKIFENLNHQIEKLKDLEVSDLETGERIKPIRRDLELSYAEYLKQGQRVPVTKKFELFCPKCNFHPVNEEVLYVHLRQKHKFDDPSAAEISASQRADYDRDMKTLKELLRNYTEHLLEDNV